MTGFLAKVKASFPEGMPLPDEFEKLFTWIEANDFVRRYEDLEYATLYPRDVADEGCSIVSFGPVSRRFASMWLGTDDPAIVNRLALFVTTGGEGSEAGLWRDDEGRLRLVHKGSGSGSALVCVLTDNPVDFLRFLAIGYGEACWLENWEMTPEEEYEEADYDEVYVPPLQFRAWVEETFGVKVPKTAAELFPHIRSREDDDDPFNRWRLKLWGVEPGA